MLAQSRQAAKIIGSGGLGKSVRQPGNAVFDERRAEVDPQAEAFVSELDVGEPPRERPIASAEAPLFRPLNADGLD